MDRSYLSNGLRTLSSICSLLDCSRTQVLQACKTKTIIDEDGEEVNLANYLILYDLKGQRIPEGVEIYYKVTNSGGLENPIAKYDVEKLTQLSPSGFSETHQNFFESATRSTLAKRSGNHSGMVGFTANTLTNKNFNCYMYTLLNGSANSVWSLPVYPQEFNDTNSANFSSVSLLGRSVDYQIYQGSSREVSFTLQLHEELSSDYGYIHRLVAQVESACYPGYSGGIVKVPEIYFSIGSQFKIRGILTGCSASWKAPIIDGKLVNCDLSVSVKETTGPYTMSDIASKGGSR